MSARCGPTLSVLVVDDEQWPRIALREQIDWAAVGVGQVREASNGSEALQIMEQDPVDIVFTDIRMPVLDGLKLMSRISERHPSVIVVVVSGYSDFRYAKHAIECGAFGYVLKPIDPAEVRGVAERAVERIRAERGRDAERDRLFHAAGAAASSVQQMLLTAMVIPRFPEETMDAALTSPEVRFRFRRVAVILVRASWSAAGRGREAGAVAVERIREATRDRANLLCFRNSLLPEEIIVLAGLADPPEEGEEESLYHLGELLVSTAAAEGEIVARAGIGRVSSGFRNLRASYDQAAEALEHASRPTGQVTVAQTVVHIDEVRRGSRYFVYPGDREQFLLSCIEHGFRDQVAGAIAELFAEAESLEGVDLSSVKSVLVDLAVGACRLAGSYGRSPTATFEDCDEVLAAVPGLRSLPELRLWFEGMASRAMNHVTERKRGGVRLVVEEVQRYLRENLHRDLTLSAVAGEFLVSGSYLSRVFPRVAGKTFVEFLTDVRMERAARYLVETELTVRGICDLVGFESENYFHKRFKEHFGCTPGEYRQRAAADP